MTTPEDDELVRKLAEIVRLIQKLREREGPHRTGFMLGLDTGLYLGRLQAELLSAREQK